MRKNHEKAKIVTSNEQLTRNKEQKVINNKQNVTSNKQREKVLPLIEI